MFIVFFRWHAFKSPLVSDKVNNSFPNDLVYIPTNRRELNKFDFSREIMILPSQVKEALNVN